MMSSKALLADSGQCTRKCTRTCTYSDFLVLVRLPTALHSRDVPFFGLIAPRTGL